MTEETRGERDEARERRTVRFAYADPPYPGYARRYYGRPEVNHALLIAHLEADFPDGWALSTSSSALRDLLPLCPLRARVGAWVKPFCSFKPGVNPAYAWEPVIFAGGRKRERSEDTVRDWYSANIVLQKGLVGAKPEPVCRWILDVLGFRHGDELADVFPGTGAMGRVVATFGAQGALDYAGTAIASLTPDRP